MSSFTDPLFVEIEQGDRDGRGLALLVRPFDYHVGDEHSADVVRVPAGFETDFCSAPWWARVLVSNFDRSAKAAVVHDFLFGQRPRTRPRREIDAIFREALGVLDVPPWRAWLMWAAVRVQAIVTGDR